MGMLVLSGTVLLTNLKGVSSLWVAVGGLPCLRTVLVGTSDTRAHDHPNTTPYSLLTLLVAGLNYNFIFYAIA